MEKPPQASLITEEGTAPYMESMFQYSDPKRLSVPTHVFNVHLMRSQMNMTTSQVMKMIDETEPRAIEWDPLTMPSWIERENKVDNGLYAPHHLNLCYAATMACLRLPEDVRAAAYATMLALGNFQLCLDQDVEDYEDVIDE